MILTWFFAYLPDLAEVSLFSLAVLLALMVLFVLLGGSLQKCLFTYFIYSGNSIELIELVLDARVSITQLVTVRYVKLRRVVGSDVGGL